MRVRGRPVAVWVLLGLLGQLSLRGTLGGLALLVEPSGALVGLPAEPLGNTPFGTFFVPGLVLLMLFGLLPSVVSYGLYERRRWAWPAAIGVALALLVWVLVEVVVGFSRPTVYLNLGTTIGIVGAALHPAVRRERRDSGA